MISLLSYIQKQLFTSVTAGSGGYLPPLTTSTSANYCFISPDLSNQTKPSKKPIEPNRTPIVRLGWVIEQNRTPILL